MRLPQVPNLVQTMGRQTVRMRSALTSPGPSLLVFPRPVSPRPASVRKQLVKRHRLQKPPTASKGVVLTLPPPPRALLSSRSSQNRTGTRNWATPVVAVQAEAMPKPYFLQPAGLVVQRALAAVVRTHRLSRIESAVRVAAGRRRKPVQLAEVRCLRPRSSLGLSPWETRCHPTLALPAEFPARPVFGPADWVARKACHWAG